MDGLSKAIGVCGSEAEMARRLSAHLGRDIRTGHVYYWKKSGFSLAAREDVIPAIEAVTGGEVRCEDLCADVAWLRDEDGKVTHYSAAVTAHSDPQPEQAQS